MEMLRAEISQLKKETRTFFGVGKEETKSPTKKTKNQVDTGYYTLIPIKQDSKITSALKIMKYESMKE